ncbi:conserved phage C-terminal domain-containing protein [Clostridium thermobutyricum]|uniref:conserved phage C-terminal domain-containing protein n=1 Tax=Clostridium thermobutyricum TaxID=29372 RepID=UPI003F51C65F
MRKIILGFDQKKAMEDNLELKDLVLLRFIVDGINDKWLLKKEIDGEVFYWVKMSAILETYPVIDLKTKDSIRRRLKVLVEKGYLKYKLYFSGGKYTFYNITNLTKELCIFNGGYSKDRKNKNLKGNKFNKKEFPPRNKVSLDNIDENAIKEVVDYLNFKIGANYKSSSNGTITYITTLIDEGFSINDFKCVIDKKYKEWAKTPYEKYLRPSTLFKKQNFEEYLNQKENHEILTPDYEAFDEF